MVIKKSIGTNSLKDSIKKGRLAIVIVGFLLAGIGLLRVLNSSEEPVVQDLSEAVSQPTAVPETFDEWLLTAELTRPEGAAQPITGAVISNALGARPQSGLHAADVVFETIAEGGVTRFVAFWQSEQPERIGPVRSLRPYFSDFAMSIDAPIAHVGGSKEAIDEAPNLAVKNLDEFFNGSFFERSTDRVAPHNVYTDFERLNSLSTTIGYQDSAFSGFTSERVVSDRSGDVQELTVNFSTTQYNPTFTYNRNANFYTRNIAGSAHVDKETKEPVGAENILVLTMSFTVDPDGRYRFNTVGSGLGTLFNAGKATQIAWSKDGRSLPFTFVNQDGTEVELEPGALWISILPAGKTVSY